MHKVFISISIFAICFFSFDKSEKAHSFNTKFPNNETIIQINGWEVVLVKDKVIYFRNRNKLITQLYDLNYIGQLSAIDKAPYLVLSGRSCKYCDENISVYLHSPDNGEMKSDGNQSRYIYPGKIFEYYSDELVFESEMYFGNCHPDYSNSVLWKQWLLNIQNEWEESTFIVQIHNGTLREIVLDGHDLFIEIEENDLCRTVEGIVVTSEP